jgi:serine phosphatase RsbU (regulator of sigma subunit)
LFARQGWEGSNLNIELSSFAQPKGTCGSFSGHIPIAKPSNLNRVLHGQITGFATCSAALIDADGTMTLANAGNLAPYCNGEELPVDPGLPLGILAAGIYSETTHQLNPNDRLTFVSDGVVEATNEKRELFGFERIQAICNQPAHAIAEAAKLFGQHDDISVLSITRISVLAETAALNMVPSPASL